MCTQLRPLTVNIFPDRNEYRMCPLLSRKSHDNSWFHQRRQNYRYDHTLIAIIQSDSPTKGTRWQCSQNQFYVKIYTDEDAINNIKGSHQILSHNIVMVNG